VLFLSLSLLLALFACCFSLLKLSIFYSPVLFSCVCVCLVCLHLSLFFPFFILLLLLLLLLFLLLYYIIIIIIIICLLFLIIIIILLLFLVLFYSFFISPWGLGFCYPFWLPTTPSTLTHAVSTKLKHKKQIWGFWWIFRFYCFVAIPASFFLCLLACLLACDSLSHKFRTFFFFWVCFLFLGGGSFWVGSWILEILCVLLTDPNNNTTSTNNNNNNNNHGCFNYRKKSLTIYCIDKKNLPLILNF
jgi:hypothetical protein